ncbi:MAG: anti-sigma factor [Fimbriimonas sp.]
MIDPLELHAYADKELDRESEDRVRRQLQDCSASQAELETILGLKATLTKHCESHDCKDQWKACVGRLDELDKVKRTESFVGKYAWALCGLFFMFIFVGGIATRLSSSNGMGSPDLARAVASLGQPISPSSQQPKEVRKWLDSLVGKASELISPENVIIGPVATGEIDGYRVSQINMRDGKGNLALLLMNADLDISDMPSWTQDLKVGKLQGVNCLIWNDQGYTLVFAGDRPYDQLEQRLKTIVISR